MKPLLTILFSFAISFGCDIRVGLIPFSGNWFSFGDYEINAALAKGEILCPGEDGFLTIELGPHYPTPILRAHRKTVSSTLFVSPLGRVSKERSIYDIIRKSTSEMTLSYPGDAIVKSIEKFHYLIYGKREP